MPGPPATLPFGFFPPFQVFFVQQVTVDVEAPSTPAIAVTVAEAPAIAVTVTPVATPTIEVTVEPC